jgi:hypothetical protein
MNIPGRYTVYIANNSSSQSAVHRRFEAKIGIAFEREFRLCLTVTQTRFYDMSLTTGQTRHLARSFVLLLDLDLDLSPCLVQSKTIVGVCSEQIEVVRIVGRKERKQKIW